MGEIYKNVWDAIYDDDPEKAALMKFKSGLMIIIEKELKLSQKRIKEKTEYNI